MPTSRVTHFRPIDAYSRIERRIPVGRLYGDVSVVHFPVICAGVVVFPVGGDIAIITFIKSVAMIIQFIIITNYYQALQLYYFMIH